MTVNFPSIHKWHSLLSHVDSSHGINAALSHIRPLHSLYINRSAKRIANLGNAISSKDVLARAGASSMPFVKQIPRFVGL